VCMALGVLLCALLVLSYSAFVPDVPLFVWSADSYIDTQNAQVRGYFSTESVEHLLKGFWKHDKHSELSKFAAHKTGSPDLVLLFLESNLSSEEFALHSHIAPTLASTMETLPSFYVPFVSAKDSDLKHGILKASRKAQHSGAKIYLLDTTDSFHVPNEHETSISTISSLADITLSFSDGNTDFVIIYGNHASSVEKLQFIERQLKEASTLFSSLKFTNYVAMFTALEATALPSDEQPSVPETEKRTQQVIQAAPTPGNGTYPPHIWTGRNTFNVYFPGIFWQLLVVLLVFWGVVALGLKLLLELQVPDRIPSGAVTKKKVK